MNGTYRELLRLCERMGSKGDVRVAFSGGVDSSLVAAAMQEATGGHVLAVTVSSVFVPQSHIRRAGRIAGHIGVAHRVLPLDVLSVPGMSDNPEDRCYRCKRALLQAMGRGGAILDGTNADDDPKRPGRKALAEFSVRSPLEELGIGKDMVRSLARELGLPNAEAPSDSCLATRFPHGTELTADRLRMIGDMEEWLRSRGVDNVRARWKGTLLYVELPEQFHPPAPPLRSAMECKAASLGFAAVEYGVRP